MCSARTAINYVVIIDWCLFPLLLFLDQISSPGLAGLGSKPWLGFLIWGLYYTCMHTHTHSACVHKHQPVQEVRYLRYYDELCRQWLGGKKCFWPDGYIATIMPTPDRWCTG